MLALTEYPVLKIRFQKRGIQMTVEIGTQAGWYFPNTALALYRHSLVPFFLKIFIYL